MIALIGGIGPLAGLNLARIITEQVKVNGIRITIHGF